MIHEQRIAFERSATALRNSPNENTRRAYAEYCAKAAELEREYDGWLRSNGYGFAVGRLSLTQGAGHRAAAGK